LEALLWSLYQEFASELQMSEQFNPLHEWDSRQPPPAAGPTPAHPTTQQIVAQLQQLAQSGVPVGAPGLTEQQIVNIAAAMLPHVAGTAPKTAQLNKVMLEKLKGAYLQAIDVSHVFLTDLTFERVTGPQELMRQEVLWQRWEVEA
jgi:hypothetical protein